MNGPWSPPEERALKTLAFLGHRMCAKVLDRSVDSVRSKASKRGWSLERKSGIVDTDLTQAVVDVVRSRNPDLLCKCGKRFIVVEGAEACEVCMKLALIERHETNLSVLEAQREVNRLKKAEQRARDELGIIPKRSRRAQA